MTKQRVTPSRVHFTIVPTFTGFTDQLIQFRALYKLGMSLGYLYVHTPFRSRRSIDAKSTGYRSILYVLSNLVWFNPRHDVYRMLGFNRYLRAIHPGARRRTRNTVEIKLSDRLLEQHHVASFEDLQNHIRSKVKSPTNEGTGVPQVRFKTGFGWRFFSWIHASIPDQQYALDLRSAYFQRREANRHASQWADGKVSLLVHVRQGDISAVETPWGTFIPVDRRRCRRGQLTEYKRAADIEGLLQPMDYYRFVKGLLSYFDESVFSIQCFSDGYHRAFDILQWRMFGLGLSPDQRRALRHSRKSYDAERFKTFQKLPDCRCYIGETHGNLCTLIHSALTAEIIVAGGQQPMLPKLITTYCHGDAPVIIILYRGAKPDYSYIRSDHNRRFVYTNIDCPDYERVLDRLTTSVGNLSSTLKVARTQSLCNLTERR